MKALIIYDSVYGNTERIAKAIGDAFGADARVVRASEGNPAELSALGILIVGCPTQGGRPTQAIQDFLGRIPETALKGVKVAAFDTRLTTKWVGLFGYAAGKIAEIVAAKGGTLIGLPEAFFVKGKKGPLKEGELERADSWAKALAK